MMGRAQDRAILLNFLHYLALYASRPYLSLLAQALGGSEVGIGLVLALYSVIQVIAALPAGRWIARRGSRGPCLWGTASFLAGCLVLTAAPNLWVMGLASLLLGLGHSLILLSGQHIVTGVTGGGERAKAVGWLSFFNSAGTFLGPMVGGPLQDFLGPNRAFFGAAGLSLLALAAAPSLPEKRGGALAEEKKNDFSALDRGVWLEVAMSGTVFFAADILAAYLALYGDQLGWTAARSGLILSANGMAQMAVRPFLGRLCRKRPARQVLRACLLAGGAFLACLGLARSFWPMLAASIAAGCAVGLANPLTLLTVSASAGEEERSQALALRVMANYAGQTLSPLLFGAMAAAMGLEPVFLCGGGVLFLCGLAAASRDTKEPSS